MKKTAILLAAVVLFCAARARAQAPLIQPPTGFGNYCSLKSGAFGYGDANSDPCGAAADNAIAFAGLWDMNGINRTFVTCSDGFRTWFASPTSGDASLRAAFEATTGHQNCKINVSPKRLPIFRHPWLPSTNKDMTTSRGVDLALHTQKYSDLQLCRGNSLASSNYELDNAGHRNWSASADDSNHSGYDWLVPGNQPGDYGVRAAADGKVILTRSRNVGSQWTLQKEVYIRHIVAKSLSTRYREEFVSYYAHLKDFDVDKGDNVNAGDLLGEVGNTGAGGSTHVHMSVFRLRNVRDAWQSYGTFGKDLEISETFAHDAAAEARAIDPFGWNNGNCVDAWGFYSAAGTGAASINLWKSDVVPPGWKHTGHN
jgi:hypothetical protein